MQLGRNQKKAKKKKIISPEIRNTNYQVLQTFFYYLGSSRGRNVVNNVYRGMVFVLFILFCFFSRREEIGRTLTIAMLTLT